MGFFCLFLLTPLIPASERRRRESAQPTPAKPPAQACASTTYSTTRPLPISSERSSTGGSSATATLNTTPKARSSDTRYLLSLSSHSPRSETSPRQGARRKAAPVRDRQRRLCAPSARGGEEAPRRRRQRRHARPRLWHVPLRHLVLRLYRRCLHRPRRAPQNDRPHDRGRQGVHDPRGWGAVSLRAAEREHQVFFFFIVLNAFFPPGYRRAPTRSRTRVRYDDWASSALRVARPGCVGALV